MTTESQIYTTDIALLKTHPLNVTVYGVEQSDPEMVRSVKEMGVLHPITVNEDKQILSGTRRYLAAREAGLEQVRTVLFTGSPAEQQQFLIESNRQRVKTAGQIASEAHELLRIEKELASARSKAGKKITTGKGLSSGRSREVVGKKLGVSGVTVDKMDAIVTAAKAGDTVAKEQKALLDKNKTTISKAHKAIKRKKKKGKPKVSAEKKEARELQRLVRKRYKASDVWSRKGKFHVRIYDLMSGQVRRLAGKR